MIKGLRELERSIESFKDVGDRVAGVAAIRLRRQVVPKMQRRIINQDAVASTELFRSFRVTKAPGDFGDEIVRLQNFAPHAPYVEFGTGGFKGPGYTEENLIRNFSSPPMSPGLVAGIRRWMYVKPGFTDPRPGLEHAIAAAIAFGGTDRFGRPRPPGTPAQPFFFNTWFEEELKFKRAMRGTFKRKVTTDFGPG